MDLVPRYFLVLLIFLIIFRTYSFQNSSKPEPKIVGGWYASLEGTRHQVSVQVGLSHICGGAIISLTKVLTAAHCLFNIYSTPVYIRKPEEFQIVMGTLHLAKFDSNTLVYKIERYVYHENFRLSDSLENDLAIMFLHGSIPEFHITAQIIQLAISPKKVGSICNVNGWGTTDLAGYVQPDLLTTNVTIISTKLCSTTYKTLSKGMFCAGNWKGGGDSCQGDSGGPLSCNGVLVGIVSWGDKCGLPGRPGVYTDVSYFRNWIIANRGKSNYTLRPLIFINLISYFFLILY